MAEQLNHLAACSALPAISLGIIPMRWRRSHWPVESFWIFDDKQVNVELVSSYLTISQSREIAEYVSVFVEMSAMAVRGDEARSLITSVIEALE
ncbi:hypothetical protein GCM10009800_06030 [Nocardiopsis rhodophaea]